MKKKYQNIFFIFGLVVLAVMVSQLHFAEVWQGLQRAGYWFFAVVVLWAFLYLFNTAAWYTIIRSGERRGAASETQENREHREAQENQDHRLRLCPQLRHARRLDGRRALPHHGP